MPKFPKLFAGQNAACIISESDDFIAFLELKPLAIGHVVVTTKREEDDFFGLTDSELSKIMVFSKRIAVALKKVVPCKKIGVAVLGLQLRQAHVHLVPLQDANDLNFTKDKLIVPTETLIDLAVQIKILLK